MDSPVHNNQTSSDTSSGLAAPGPVVHWLPAIVTALLVGLAVGIASGALHAAGISLIAIQSLAVGAVVGVALVGIAATARLARPTWRAAILAAAVAIATQHLWIHRQVMAGRRAAIDKEPAAAMFRPGWSEQSFGQYLQSEATPQAIGLWVLDACLLTAAAVGIVEVGRKTVASTSSGDMSKPNAP